MSVILMSGKKSAQKFKEGSKKKDKETKEKYSGVQSVNAYMPSDNVDVWNCVLDSSPISIAFCKDSLEIWCNDALMIYKETLLENDDIGMDFELMHHKIRIITNSVKTGIKQYSSLTLDGETIPPVANISNNKNENGRKSKVTSVEDGNKKQN